LDDPQLASADDIVFSVKKTDAINKHNFFIILSFLKTFLDELPSSEIHRAPENPVAPKKQGTMQNDPVTLTN